MIGRTISHYEVLEEVGRGGMGVLYLARDTRLEQTVAIKVLRPDAIASAERRQRFLREAQAASALNHARVVTVSDIDRTLTPTAGGRVPAGMVFVPSGQQGIGGRPVP